MKKFILAVIFALAWPLVSLFFLGLSVLTYTRLTDEDPIATVYFNKTTDKEYVGFLSETDGKKREDEREYKILGDQWRIDAQFIKLRPWANIIGFDSRYNLERFEGRYRRIQDQNTLPKMAYDLGEEKTVSIPDFFIKYNIFIDAEYGSSSYKDIDVKSVYTVYRTQSGIIIRETPRSEENADDSEKSSFFTKMMNKVEFR
jgi:hypothetical protein